MKLNQALKKSSKGTACREYKDIVENKVTIIAYKDGSFYRMVSKNGKVLFGLSGQPRDDEYLRKNDWQPSQRK